MRVNRVEDVKKSMIEREVVKLEDVGWKKKKNKERSF